VNKPLKIAPWVVPEDLQAIYDYHKPFSAAKAERIVAEYDRIVGVLEVNPLIFRPREDHWRVYPFSAGTYLLYYREFPPFWLVVGVFHARREPSWISEQVSHRLKRFS
jgi:plasmid stabilization system protein ParE